MPGEQADNFSGTGWQLSGGAKIVTATLADGSTGSVLDMPSGATAVSPVMCVSSADPNARTMVRDLVGSEGVFVYDSYDTASGWSNPQNLGQVHGQQTNWTLSDRVDIHSSSVQTTTPVQFTFNAGGKTSHFQVYDFYVDPHCAK